MLNLRGGSIILESWGGGVGGGGGLFSLKLNAILTVTLFQNNLKLTASKQHSARYEN